MTIVLDVPAETEARLREEAERAGMSLPELAVKILGEHKHDPADAIQRLVDEFGGPGPELDLSREAIYAE